MKVLTVQETRDMVILLGYRAKKSKFHDPVRLEMLCKMYECGMSLSAIARYFEVDHTSVLYHVRRLKIIPNCASLKDRMDVHALCSAPLSDKEIAKVLNIPYVPVVKIKDDTLEKLGSKVFVPKYHKPVISHLDVDGTVIHAGRSYASYLKEAARKSKEFIMQARKFGFK